MILAFPAREMQAVNNRKVNREDVAVFDADQHFGSAM